MECIVQYLLLVNLLGNSPYITRLKYHVKIAETRAEFLTTINVNEFSYEGKNF